MKRALWVILLTGSAAWGHDYIIEPVRIDLRATEQTIQATIRTNAGYWCDQILGVEVPPPSRWPQELRTAAKSYIDSRFQLSLDGKRLDTLLLDARYRREPWQEGYDSQLIFELTFPKPAPGGRVVTGRATFFKEHRKDHTAETDIHPDDIEPAKDYRTFLELRGQTSRQIIVSLDHPDFEFPLTDILRSPAQQRLDRASAALRRFWSTAAVPLLALALAALVWYARGRP